MVLETNMMELNNFSSYSVRGLQIKCIFVQCFSYLFNTESLENDTFPLHLTQCPLKKIFDIREPFLTHQILIQSHLKTFAS